MILRIYPDLIVEDTLANYESAYAIEQIRLELVKREPSVALLNYLLNGSKYDHPIDH